MRQMLNGFAADSLVTLNYNESALTIPEARERLKHFHAVVDRKVIGQRWHLKPAAQRTFFIAVPERGREELLHHHLLLRAARGVDLAQLEQVARSRFRASVAPAGSVHWRSIRTDADHRGVVDYMTKGPGIADFVISIEFVR
jgi:hypothetical protein